jgi:outer membrane protein OmpA-like peptidoglycan-associated protein
LTAPPDSFMYDMGATSMTRWSPTRMSDSSHRTRSGPRLKRPSVTTRQHQKDLRSDVVTGPLVFGPRIAEPDDELHAGVTRPVDGVFPATSTSGRGWIGFVADAPDFGRAVSELRDRTLEIGPVLVDAIVETAWYQVPNALAVGAGLGWLFDDRVWWFPPMTPDRWDVDTRVLNEALRSVTSRVTVDSVEFAEFLTDQVVRRHDPSLWRGAGSFGHETRAYLGQPPDAAIAAYEERVHSLTGAREPVVTETAKALRRHLTWTDGLLTMVEHGAVGVLHNLLPGVAGTGPPGQLMATNPEWTDPQLTGQWDAKESLDTLILNQAGIAIAGYLQRLKPSGRPRRLDRYVLKGTLRGGARLGGPLEFAVTCWRQLDRTRDPNAELWIYNESLLGAPIDTGATITIAVTESGVELTLHLDLGTGRRSYDFRLNNPYAHHTHATVQALTPSVAARLLDSRDAPLHAVAQYVVDTLTTRAITYVNRYLDENPSGAGLIVMFDEFGDDLTQTLGDLTRYTRQDEAGTHSDLIVTARQEAKVILDALTPPGGESYLGILTLMFRREWAQSRYVQSVYDIMVAPGGTHRYAWRLRDVGMYGGAYFVGGAAGTALFDFQEVDERRQPVGAVMTRRVDLATVEGGVTAGPMFGPGSVTDWQYFDATGREVLPEHLDGAVFEMFGISASLLIVESNSAVEVSLWPQDELDEPLTGRMDGALVKWALSNPFEQGIDPLQAKDRIEKAKEAVEDLKEAGKEFLKKNWRKGLKSIKKPEVKMSWTTGWLRTAAGASTAPSSPVVDIGSYVSTGDAWVRFATDRYAITTDFRDRVRFLLLWNLLRFQSATEVSVEGYASQVGTSDYNKRLSRDRAQSVLIAMYDILGPQLAAAFGDVTVKAYGDEFATGDPNADEALDRRVDVVVDGLVRHRS